MPRPTSCGVISLLGGGWDLLKRTWICATVWTSDQRERPAGKGDWWLRTPQAFCRAGPGWGALTAARPRDGPISQRFTTCTGKLSGGRVAAATAHSTPGLACA